MAQSILANLDPARIDLEPFPHVWRRGALDPSHYAELADAFPSLERIAGCPPLPNNQVYRIPSCDVLADAAMPGIWRDFFSYHSSRAFLEELLRFWKDAIAREYPNIEQRFGKPLAELTAQMRHYRPGKPPESLSENMRTDVTMDTQFVVNSPVTEISTVRGPHLDKPYKLFAAILYMRHPDDRSSGGNLQLYRLSERQARFDRRQHLDERAVEPFDEVPYEANTVVLWLNTPLALHGVTPRSATRIPRRYINFVTECYALPTDTFFDLDRTLWAKAYGAAKRMVRRRMIRQERRRSARS